MCERPLNKKVNIDFKIPGRLKATGVVRVQKSCSVILRDRVGYNPTQQDDGSHLTYFLSEHRGVISEYTELQGL